LVGFCSRDLNINFTGAGISKPKVFAREDFVTDIKVLGMVHGRMIRPAIAGAVRRSLVRCCWPSTF
jgi:hypothetical protein